MQELSFLSEHAVSCISSVRLEIVLSSTRQVTLVCFSPGYQQVTSPVSNTKHTATGVSDAEHKPENLASLIVKFGYNT